MIAASKEAIESVYDGDGHVGLRVRGHLAGETREFSRRAVVFAADCEPFCGHGGGFSGWRSLREEADGEGVLDAGVGGAGADNIIGEHAGYVHGGVFVGLGHEGGAVEALLFACASSWL